MLFITSRSYREGRQWACKLPRQAPRVLTALLAGFLSAPSTLGQCPPVLLTALLGQQQKTTGNISATHRKKEGHAEQKNYKLARYDSTHCKSQHSRKSRQIFEFKDTVRPLSKNKLKTYRFTDNM